MISGKNIGYFMTLEGIEGVGKSTQAEFIVEYLIQQGKEVVHTREPGGTEVADHIRHLLLADYEEPMHVDTELLLIFASRAQHSSRVIRPALASGKWVVCDRFTASSYAYQGGGHDIDFERIAQLEQWVLNGLQPDLTLLFDLPVEQALARVAKRQKLDRIEMESVIFFSKVRDAYLKLAELDPAHYRIISTVPSIEQVQLTLKHILQLLL